MQDSNFTLTLNSKPTGRHHAQAYLTVFFQPQAYHSTLTTTRRFLIITPISHYKTHQAQKHVPIQNLDKAIILAELTYKALFYSVYDIKRQR